MYPLLLRRERRRFWWFCQTAPQVRTPVVEPVAVDVVDALVRVRIEQVAVKVDERFLAMGGDEAASVAAADIEPFPLGEGGVVGDIDERREAAREGKTLGHDILRRKKKRGGGAEGNEVAKV